MKSSRVRLGDLSVGFTQPLAAALRAKGHDPQPLLQQFGLDTARLSEPRARLSIPRYMRLGHSAIALCADPALGLEMGRHSHPSQVGLAGICAAQAPNLREAARTLTRFEPLYAANYRGRSSFHEDPCGAWLRFYSISPYNAYNRFVVDSVLSGWLAQLSALAGQPLVAERIDIEFDAPAYAERYQALSLTPVQFAAQTNQLRLGRAVLDLRAELASVRTPTLLIHGERDPLMPLGAARWLAQTLPQTRLETFADAAHAPFLHDPDRFTALVGDFCHASA